MNKLAESLNFFDVYELDGRLGIGSRPAESFKIGMLCMVVDSTGSISKVEYLDKRGPDAEPTP